jgi:hypothetical protein
MGGGWELIMEGGAWGEGTRDKGQSNEWGDKEVESRFLQGLAPS